MWGVDQGPIVAEAGRAFCPKMDDQAGEPGRGRPSVGRGDPIEEPCQVRRLEDGSVGGRERAVLHR